MAYDPAPDQLMLFGGLNGTQRPGRHLDLERHHLDPPNPRHRPPARNGAAMAYDPATGQLVLFGGNGDGTELGALERHLDLERHHLDPPNPRHQPPRPQRRGHGLRSRPPGSSSSSAARTAAP